MEIKIMNIDNLQRASNAKVELEKLNKAIEEFAKFDMKRLGLFIGANKDGSGAGLDFQFKDGNYHPMYTEILEFVEKRFRQAKEELIAEIETL
jgi:hypothetical protein